MAIEKLSDTAGPYMFMVPGYPDDEEHDATYEVGRGELTEVQEMQLRLLESIAQQLDGIRRALQPRESE